ncbi:MAG: hypothetical protein ABSC92_07765 [Rhizomicrobium sp.]|jgi:hypothetical protein
MQEVEVTGSRLLSVWWLVVWRGFVGGAVLGSIAGAIAGFVVAVIGHREWGIVAGAIAGYVLSIPWSVVVLRMALKKHYRGFRIALVSEEAKL